MLGQPRATQRYQKKTADDEVVLTKRIVELASEYGRYGYRRVTALLRQEGWLVNHKCIERIWRRERLKVPQNQLVSLSYNVVQQYGAGQGKLKKFPLQKNLLLNMLPLSQHPQVPLHSNQSLRPYRPWLLLRKVKSLHRNHQMGCSSRIMESIHL